MWVDSFVWNQYSRWIDAEVRFYKYRFVILFLEMFLKQHKSRFALFLQMIYKSIYLICYWTRAIVQQHVAF